MPADFLESLLEMNICQGDNPTTRPILDIVKTACAKIRCLLSKITNIVFIQIRLFYFRYLIICDDGATRVIILEYLE